MEGLPGRYQLELVADLVGQVGQVSAVDSDADGPVAALVEGQGHGREVRDARPADGSVASNNSYGDFVALANQCQ